MTTSQSDNYKTKSAPPRIVIINTQYVKTDSVSFKDVVQKLTGKDSKVNGGNDGAPKRPSISNKSNHESSTSFLSSGFLTRDISFKDFERMLREMPPIDETWVD